MERNVIYTRKLKPQEFPFPRDKRSLLGQLDIELTERCNNNCIHCCINLPEDAPARNREMDTAFLREIVTQAADLGCLTVRFTGGEPLLRDDFADLYLFTRRLGMQVIVFTNGRLITPELAALFAKYPPGKPVEISVYGMHPESYDAASGRKGAFQEFRRGMELLQRHGVRFVVKSSILPPNRGDMAAFEQWMAELDVEDHRPRYAMNFDLRSRRDDPGKNGRIEKLRLSPEETVRVLARTPRYLEEMRDFCGKFIGPPGEKLFSCGAGHGACIDAYGRAQMCLPLRDPETVVDLRKATLKSALEETFPKLCETRATHPDYLARCARCFLKGLCEQCPAKSWMEHGTLDTPVEYLCEVAHAQAGYLGLIREGEKAWEVEDWRERRTLNDRNERKMKDGTRA
jgi:radical SAM protein with 4Fe4S-binding SPASM domain